MFFPALDATATAGVPAHVLSSDMRNPRTSEVMRGFLTSGISRGCLFGYRAGMNLGRPVSLGMERAQSEQSFAFALDVMTRPT